MVENINEYYVYNPFDRPIGVGDIFVKPFKTGLASMTATDASIAKSKGFTVQRRLADAEYGIEGIGKAGGGVGIVEVAITQAAYDALPVKDPYTLYVING